MSEGVRERMSEREKEKKVERGRKGSEMKGMDIEEGERTMKMREIVREGRKRSVIGAFQMKGR